jgi:hypothetical protein
MTDGMYTKSCHRIGIQNSRRWPWECLAAAEKYQGYGVCKSGVTVHVRGQLGPAAM